MKKNDLLEKDGGIIRVLTVEWERVQIIDCLRKTMPVWMDKNILNDYEPMTEEDLLERLDVDLSEGNLTPKQNEVMHTRFSLISPILPFIANDRLRGQLIREISENNGISVQTVRGLMLLF